MKKITKEEFDSYIRGNRNPVLSEVLKLDIDEGLEVSFDEWHGNHGTPSSSLANLTRNKEVKRRFTVKTDKSNRVWRILRVK